MPANSDPLPGPAPLAERPGAGAPAERTVLLPKHLHARPAGQVAQAAARHQTTTIELIAGARRANARSVLAVMALGAVSGSEVRISVAGPGHAAVLTEIVEILLAPEE
ncbi:MAG TPA: HPr family phosphocarrier protein [Pilimelia sp.]|nr:HPr family phosphocarrier protein [Pilimelia sp.]